jgi:alkylation response protein AidB-like acyl-CoA dehydrogenase
MARLRFDATPARLLEGGSGAWPVVQHVLDIAAAVLATEQVGGAQRVLEMATDYARERIQFGRPIGSFQAIKHKCADMLVEVEAARSAAYRALAAAEAGEADLPLLASIAKAYCSDAYLRCATDNIQVHGGMGFTWEHPAHLYFRRAKSSELLLGDPTYHRSLVAERAGI